MHMIWGGGFPYLFSKHTALVHARRFTNASAFTSQNNSTTLFYSQDTEAQLPPGVSGITGVPPRQTDSPAACYQGWDGLQTTSFLTEGAGREDAWASVYGLALMPSCLFNSFLEPLF